MQASIQSRFAAQIALFFLATAVQADITLAVPPPPQADPEESRVLRGEAVTIPLRGHHRGSGTVTFWIVQRPAHGTLSDLRLLGDNQATVIYRNDGEETVARDRFTYLVKTSREQPSSPAEVQIAVDEPAAKLRVPAQIEFAEIMAGASETQLLTIRNEGGGVLEGRLTVSAPWAVAAPEYRVRSGASLTIAVAFRPNEARDFVGQITLSDSGNGPTAISLTGRATSPLRVEPATIRIVVPKNENEARSAAVTLTNRTEETLRLKVEMSSNFQPVAEIVLAPREQRVIELVVRLSRTIPLRERVTIIGQGFRAPMEVESAALPPPLVVTEQTSSMPPPVTVALVSATPTTPTVRAPLVPIAAPPAPSASPGKFLVAVRAKRLDPGWELRWPQPKNPVANYRIEERFLALDGTDGLQTSWRPLPLPKIANSGDSAVAQLKGLAPKELHILRVTALKEDGSTLWESPLVALSPPRAAPRNGRGWLLTFVVTLAIFLVVRWSANRAGPRPYGR